MENRIKEYHLDLFADRTSAATMRANQLRLWFASMAYIPLCALRRIGRAHSQFASATCGTIRLKTAEECSGPRQRATREDRDDLGLSLSAGVRARPRLAGQRRPLTRTSKRPLHSPRYHRRRR
jgi:hypothetical protein